MIVMVVKDCMLTEFRWMLRASVEVVLFGRCNYCWRRRELSWQLYVPSGRAAFDLKDTFT